ncbi:MAG: PilN domain-containing protein [Nitrospiria bacterium]
MVHEQINLLQAMSIGQPSDLRLQPAWISWGMAIFILLTVFGLYRKGSDISDLNDQIAGLRDKQAFLVQEMGAAEAAMKDVVQTLAVTLSNRIRWSQLMREVSLIIPEGVWTTRWESVASRKDPRKPNARGNANDMQQGPEIKILGEAISQAQLTLFLSTLDRSPLLNGARLAHARRVSGEVHFEIVINLKREKAA